ncbi:MAG: hypothetical protein ACI95C_000813 [Pseudohongiellaceae bacterium]
MFWVGFGESLSSATAALWPFGLEAIVFGFLLIGWPVECRLGFVPRFW